LGQKWKKGIPIEVLPMACKPVQNKIEVKYGGEAILRMSADKAVGSLVTIQNTLIIIF
jgi:ribose 5-phosphate isomerase A